MVDRTKQFAFENSEVDRTGLASVIRHPWFERFIVAVIVVNAITLGLETSGTVMARFGTFLHALDTIILAIFVIEIIVRMVVYKLAFWRDPWSLFDFTVVAITLIPATGNLSVLRALRILRVLRLVSAVPSIRRVVAGLLTAIPGMGSIVLLLLLINYVFAVITTKLYGATFPEMFGTIGASLYTLFQVMTLEGWSGDVVRPVMEKHPFAWAVFVPYIVVVTFAVLNLFIGIVVDAMQQQGDESRGQIIEVTEREFEALMGEIKAMRDELRDMRETHGPKP
ncbi:MAG: ion transporter [Alphaproteobacteria bacterium]|nr:ion transporter [Alphaproteobacteria bacterium]